MDQNLNNHRKYVLGYHGILLLLLIAGIIGAVVNVCQSYSTGNCLNASLILVLFLAMAVMYWYVRQFPLKAQDRAIIAQENLRYYVLTGKLLPYNVEEKPNYRLAFC